MWCILFSHIGSTWLYAGAATCVKEGSGGGAAAAAAAADKIILFSRGKSEETHFSNSMFFGRYFSCELIHSRSRKKNIYLTIV